MIEFLFLDMDDTILDFQKAEHTALRKTLLSFGIEPTEPVCSLYSRINLDYWKRLERKELTRDQLRTGRFETFFAQLGIQGDAAACAQSYEDNLSCGHDFLPGAREAVESLSKKYELYLASNGTSQIQRKRIASADISQYFQDIFISEEMGADKPDPAYFQSCFARIPGFDPGKAMIVGDSLTSDMRGGIGAGLKTCWINPGHKPVPEDMPIGYQLESITGLESLLEGL